MKHVVDCKGVWVSYGNFTNGTDWLAIQGAYCVYEFVGFKAIV